jgi:hypothetical protein
MRYDRRLPNIRINALPGIVQYLSDYIVCPLTDAGFWTPIGEHME